MRLKKWDYVAGVKQWNAKATEIRTAMHLIVSLSKNKKLCYSDFGVNVRNRCDYFLLCFSMSLEGYILVPLSWISVGYEWWRRILQEKWRLGATYTISMAGKGCRRALIRCKRYQKEDRKPLQRKMPWKERKCDVLRKNSTIKKHSYQKPEQ